ncbi:MAG: hypothetical protein H6Q90_4460, partial [Deltaproteobacteria bacterium]|nr:hypothetical protein [Deltaproteobacteria bacterium]
MRLPGPVRRPDRLMRFMTALVLSLAFTACMPPPQDPMASYAQIRATPTPGGGGPACAGMMQPLKESYCAPLDPKGQIRQPSPDVARETEQFNALIAQSRAGLRQQCPGPDLDAQFAEMDRCLETKRAAGKVEQEEQAVRLPRERRLVAAIKADPRHREALARHRGAIEARQVAIEDLEDARTRQGLDCGRRQDDCARLSTLRERVDAAESKRKR